MTTTYAIQNLANGPIGPFNIYVEGTPIQTVESAQSLFLIQPDAKEKDRFLINLIVGQGKDLTVKKQPSLKEHHHHEYLETIKDEAQPTKWILTKSASGNFIIIRADDHAHWEVSNKALGTVVNVLGGHDHQVHHHNVGGHVDADDLTTFLGKLVQPGSHLTLKDYPKPLGDEIFFKITPAPF